MNDLGPLLSKIKFTWKEALLNCDSVFDNQDDYLVLSGG